jgi:signal transduction histidine kinase
MSVPRRYAAAVSPRSPLLRDAALALALALIAFVPPLATHGTRLGELPQRPLDALAVAAALAQSLPLAFRGRWPAVTLAVVAAGFAVQELRGYATFASLGLLIAIYSVAAHQNHLRRSIAGVATAGYLMLSAGLHLAGSMNRVADFVVFYLCLAAAWLLGAYVRTMRSAEDIRRQVEADAARADERARIARELHDVVTHHVTAMVVQANAAQFLELDPARESLTAIKETGKKALGDLRDLLGVLDPSREARRDRLPGLAEVPSLVEQTRAAGQPVSLIEEGRPPAALGGGRELTAYRVVQESLTNALKYAAGRPTVVRLGYGSSSVDITVSTAPSQRSSSTHPAGVHIGRRGEPLGGSSRGLTGLRERLELFGGSLSAGPDDDGGFTVAAHLPAGGLPPAQPATSGGLPPAQPATSGGLSPAQPATSGGLSPAQPATEALA